jgi:hypothetical protein
MRRVALAVGILMLVAAACGGDDGATRNPEGVIIEPGDISVFDLAPGDCFDVAADRGGAEVQTVYAVPCVEPHDNEIYLAFDLDDGAFPGRAAVDDQADEHCLDGFETFVGSEYHESALGFFAITPTAESWEEGDRTVYCSLFADDLGKLIGSMEGTGR